MGETEGSLGHPLSPLSADPSQRHLSPLRLVFLQPEYKAWMPALGVEDLTSLGISPTGAEDAEAVRRRLFFMDLALGTLVSEVEEFFLFLLVTARDLVSALFSFSESAM